MPQNTFKFLIIFFISILNLNLLLGSNHNFKKKSLSRAEAESDRKVKVNSNQKISAQNYGGFQPVIHGRMGHNFENHTQKINKAVFKNNYKQKKYHYNQPDYQHEKVDYNQSQPTDFKIRPYQYQASSLHPAKVAAASSLNIFPRQSQSNEYIPIAPALSEFSYPLYPTSGASYFNQVSHYHQHHPQNPYPRIQNRQDHVPLPIFTSQFQPPFTLNFYFLNSPPVDPVDVLKKKIFQIIADLNDFEPASLLVSDADNIVELDSLCFLSKMSEISLSTMQNAKTHLQWFMEFVHYNYNIKYQENLIDYFDYIKVNHIVPELDINSGVDVIKVIHFCILKLIENNCRIPDIIKSLCQLGHKRFTPQQSKEIYASLRNSIEHNEMKKLISTAGYKRYVFTIEILLEFVEFSKEDVMLLARPDIESQASTVSMLRTILHYAPLFHALLGLQNFSREEIIRIIKLKYTYLDGSVFRGDRLTNAKALNYILKKGYIHVMNIVTDQKEAIMDRFENTADVLVSFFKLNDFYFFVSNHLNFLVDIFIFHVDEKFKINFEALVLASYKKFNSKIDKFNSLYIISMYIASNPMTLNEFREKYLYAFYDFDYDFLLILETLIAAVEEVKHHDFGFFVTWEPSREFLVLQQNNLMFQYDSEDIVDPKFQLLDSSYLLFVSKIFLTRQHGYQFSYFQTKFSCENSSWKDVLDFVNFFLSQLYDEQIAEKINLTSEFCKDMDKLPNFPAFEEMMARYDLNNYQSKKIYSDCNSN